MAARLLDGKALARTMRDEIAARAADYTRNQGRNPGLAAVLVGNDPASHRYVRSKRKACHEAGLESWLHQLPNSTTQSELLGLIAKLNS
ncbi:MAG TPA: tetrahydrofolate dehydrogenase/cyclohydrolase catalytic domain-containing protein, partial [Gemmataceae bacterium]|nr:tetrahydrofolate dehydrogenase/cyclohydrolase catalytic domain-containing protein [Gemmataceae bacterium]